MGTPLAVYLHIPFCRQKCGYCDFLSFAGREDLFQTYLAVLGEEIRLLAGERPPVATVYIGGGTPTLFSGEELASLIKEVKAATRLEPGLRSPWKPTRGLSPWQSSVPCGRRGSTASASAPKPVRRSSSGYWGGAIR